MIRLKYWNWDVILCPETGVHKIITKLAQNHNKQRVENVARVKSTRTRGVEKTQERKAEKELNISIRVDGATDLNLCGGQSVTNFSSGITRTFAAAASDWLILVPTSVVPSTRIKTFG